MCHLISFLYKRMFKFSHVCLPSNPSILLIIIFYLGCVLLFWTFWFYMFVLLCCVVKIFHVHLITSPFSSIPCLHRKFLNWRVLCSITWCKNISIIHKSNVIKILKQLFAVKNHIGCWWQYVEEHTVSSCFYKNNM